MNAKTEKQEPEKKSFPAVCRLCLEVSFSEDLYPVKYLYEVFKEVFSDLDLRLSKDPEICMNCKNLLTSTYNFKNRCLENEQKIKQCYNKINTYVNLYELLTIKLNDNEELQRTEAKVITRDLSSDSDVEFVEDCSQSHLKSESTSLKNEQMRQEETKILPLPVDTKINSYISMEDVIFNWSSDLEELSNETENIFEKSDTERETQHIEIEPLQKDNENIIYLSDDSESTELVQPSMLKSRSQIDLGNNSKGLKCDYKSTHKRKVSKKIQGRHGNLYSCNVCHKLFKQKIGLDAHYLDQHKDNFEVQKLVTRKVHYCDFCQYKSVYKMYLTHHISVKHKQLKIKYKSMYCAHCNYKTTFKGNLILHMRRHSVISPFLCFFCRKSCNQKCSLHAHILRHHLKEIDPNTIDKIVTSKMYKCDVCEFRCLSRAECLIHINRHKINTQN